MAFTPFVESDQPTMATFNDKFRAIITEAISKSLRIETGSYVGTGTGSTAESPMSILFSGNPIIVFVWGTANPSYGVSCWFFPIFYGKEHDGTCWHEYNGSSPWSHTEKLHPAKDGNSLKWYVGSNSETDIGRNLNKNGYTYRYVAIIE